MLPLWVRVDLGVMPMKEYSALPKAPALLKPHYQIVLCHTQDTQRRGSYPFAEMQSVYSTAPADWALYLIENLAQMSFCDKSDFQNVCVKESFQIYQFFHQVDHPIILIQVISVPLLIILINKPDIFLSPNFSYPSNIKLRFSYQTYPVIIVQ